MELAEISKIHSFTEPIIPQMLFLARLLRTSTASRDILACVLGGVHGGASHRFNPAGALHLHLIRKIQLSTSCRTSMANAGRSCDWERHRL